MTVLPFQDTKNYSDLVEDIVLQLVDNTEAVDVTEMQDDAGMLRIVIKVDKEEKGKVIGREGATVKSIHKLLIAIRRGDNISVDIID
jgi:predicted RNA-binding protein YlqC (UPF0109 family)